MEDNKRGESSLASFLACIEESINEREGKQFEEGLDSKIIRYVQRVWERNRGICIGLVMQELDYCLSLGQEHMA